jgi:hypothetical protein
VGLQGLGKHHGVMAELMVAHYKLMVSIIPHPNPKRHALDHAGRHRPERCTLAACRQNSNNGVFSFLLLFCFNDTIISTAVPVVNIYCVLLITHTDPSLLLAEFRKAVLIHGDVVSLAEFMKVVFNT